MDTALDSLLQVTLLEQGLDEVTFRGASNLNHHENAASPNHIICPRRAVLETGVVLPYYSSSVAWHSHSQP